MGTRGKLLVGFLVFCLCASFLQAQVVKKSQGSLDDLVAASPRLQVSQVVMPMEQIRSEAAALQAPGMAAVVGDWDRFLTENGAQWTLQLDRRTGRPALVSGSGLPWIPGVGNHLTKDDIRENLGASGQVNRGTLVRLSKQFIRQYPELFGVDVADLEVSTAGTSEVGGYLWYVKLDRKYQGIPVEKSYVIFRVNHGNLVQFGGEFMGRISVDTIPTISLETAQQIVAGYLGGMSAGDEWMDNGQLTILPLAPQGDAGVYNLAPGEGVDYHLVYTLTFRRDGVMGTWQAKVDAHTGEVLSFLDANEYGSVKGGIYITSNLDTEVVRPMPFAGVGTSTYANAAGVYSATSGTVTGSFTGKYVKVTDSCGTSALAVTAPADINFSTSTGTDCTTPGVGGAGNTHAARTGYYHLTLWKMKAMAWLPSNTWLTGQVGDKVNLNQTCNAYWDGSAVNFFKSGGGCSNTGELPTVFLHEIGHGLDSNDGSPSSTVGSSESYGDTHRHPRDPQLLPGRELHPRPAVLGLRQRLHQLHGHPRRGLRQAHQQHQPRHAGPARRHLGLPLLQEQLLPGSLRLRRPLRVLHHVRSGLGPGRQGPAHRRVRLQHFLVHRRPPLLPHPPHGRRFLHLLRDHGQRLRHEQLAQRLPGSRR